MQSRVRIGIVDSGLDGTHPWLSQCTVSCWSVEECASERCHDVYGHGTGVATLIHSLCPDAELYMARITQSGLQTPFNMVPEADIAAGIQWCVDQGVKIVNVSYGISAVEGELTEACHNAAQAEVIVIASHSNVNGALVYPAAFKNVVGVYRSRTAKLGEISVSSLENMDVAAFGGPFYVGAASHGVSYMGGTSFAGAQVSAVLGQILERRSELTIAEAFATLLCLEVSENELRASK